jgi:hypothetical protein
MGQPHLSLPRLVRRVSAPRLVLDVLIAFGATVLIVRLYLELTGYPRLGNATLHIAHMLYGGIVLTIASLLMIIYASPTAIRIGAILTGIGLGLFFDEVGKFITANNDYFYRPAAPIIYLIAVGIALLFVMLRRREMKPTDSELLVEALEHTEALLEGQQTLQQRRRIDATLDRIAHNMSDPDHVKLAMALREFADSEGVRQGQSPLQRVISKIELIGLRYFIRHQNLITCVLLVQLALNSLFSLVTFAAAVLLPADAPGLAHTIQSIFNSAGLRAWSPFLLSIDNIDLALEFITAIITLFGIMLFLTGRRRQGLFLVKLALILQLCVVNVFTFYVEQFSAALLTLSNLFALLCVRAYEHQSRQSAVARHYLSHLTNTPISPLAQPEEAEPAPPATLNKTNL